MNKWLRRIRGAIGMGLTWAIGWLPIGAVLGFVTGVVLGFPLAGIAWNYAVMFGVLGFVGGAIFSAILRLTEGRRRFDELSIPRFAAWGGIGGLLLGGLAVSIGLLGADFSAMGAVMAGTSTLLGAASAAGSLALARAAEDDELLEAGDRAGDVGLTAEEARQLLGGGD